ncbi:MAG: Fimbrillin-like [Bacteroidetes bacterium]|nr:Fimbrillin-like [Bacteroidota bacterium]
MKIKSIYIALLVLLNGCSGDSPVQTSMVALRLSATQTGIVTKGADSALPLGSVTGIYVTAKDAAIAASYFGNQKYTSGASGALLTDASVSLTIGSSYDIYAYAPYQAGVITPIAVEFPYGTDVLWAPKFTISGVSESNNSALLSFEHRAAQITFKVVFADDFNEGPKEFTSSSAISVSGFYNKGLLDITTGMLTPSGVTNITLSAFGKDTAGVITLGTDTTCFIPATGIMPLSVVVSHGGRVYNGVIKETFVSGHSYNYTVTISGQLATLGISGVMEQWIPVSDDLIVR